MSKNISASTGTVIVGTSLYQLYPRVTNSTRGEGHQHSHYSSFYRFQLSLPHRDFSWISWWGHVRTRFFSCFLYFPDLFVSSMARSNAWTSHWNQWNHRTLRWVVGKCSTVGCVIGWGWNIYKELPCTKKILQVNNFNVQKYINIINPPYSRILYRKKKTTGNKWYKL